VLVRTNVQTAAIETALRRASIPYRLRGGHRFLDDQDVRDLLARFERMREPLATTIEDLTASVAVQRSAAIVQHHGDLDDEDGPIEAMALPDTAVGRRIAAFEQVIRLAHELLAVDVQSRTDSFPGWLRAVMRDDDASRGDAVTLSSFHAAKGLEWDVVHLAGVEAGYVPISHARTPEAQAEELRLFYVAVTRAAEVLRCTWAASRTFGERTFERKPSPYLDAVRSTVAVLERSDQPTPAPRSAIDESRTALDQHPPSGPAPDATVEHIDRALRAWRAQTAREAGVRPTVVIGERALRSVAAQRPRTPADLERVAGLGPLLRARHGARLLAIVAEHVEEPPEAPCASS
jgi:DNA helicase-2/ATP-dependent DNA helicase PcrA